MQRPSLVLIAHFRNSYLCDLIILLYNSTLLSAKAKPSFLADCAHCGAREKSIFCNLDPENVALFNEVKSCVVYKKGQLLFSEGGYPLGVFCVNAGKIKLSRTGQDGKEQIVRLGKEGDVLGYRALLSGERYGASAVTLDDTTVCFVPRDAFFEAVKKSPGLSLEIIKALSVELGRAEQTITDLAQKPVRERLAEGLLFLKETYGFEEDGATLAVVLSREDLANLVGTATETVIRLLSELKHDKIVASEGKKIRILDMARLIRTANIQD